MVFTFCRDDEIEKLRFIAVLVSDSPLNAALREKVDADINRFVALAILNCIKAHVEFSICHGIKVQGKKLSATSCEAGVIEPHSSSDKKRIRY